MEITFPFFDLSCLSFLVSINEPLEVVLFKLSDIRMIFLLSNLDALIPSMQFLVHGHCFFDLIVL